MDTTTAREIKHLKQISYYFNKSINQDINATSTTSSAVPYDVLHTESINKDTAAATANETYISNQNNDAILCNCVQLYDIACNQDKFDDIFLIFEYCEHDLQSLLNKFKHPFNEAEIKCLVLQLLYGLEFLHNKGKKVQVN
jgi:serine/threonine protein kinase